VELRTLTSAIDRWLNTAGTPDFPGAHNGLQVEGQATVDTIATAVDACTATAVAAANAGAQLLIVHHGLLWNDPAPIVGPLAATLRTLLGAGCGLYAAHLPLDGHDEFGNNAILARRLGLRNPRPFGEFAGFAVGRIGAWSGTVAEAANAMGLNLVEAVSPARPVECVAVVSGSGKSLIADAAEAGAQVLLTGEVDHHARVAARDLGLGLWLGGHYATETWGVRALGERLAREFSLRHVALDFPTGG
jgi:dinuclear metal center YbgI/SA1388 family protein